MPNIKVVFDGLFIGVPGLYHEALSLPASGTSGEPPTLEKAIEALAAKHGDRFKDMIYDKATGDISPQVAILLNGGRATPDARLQEADELAFLIPIAGGANLTPPKESV